MGSRLSPVLAEPNGAPANSPGHIGFQPGGLIRVCVFGSLLRKTYSVS